MSQNDFNLDFVGVGTMRSASTWLYSALSNHEQVCMTVPKETHFFSDNKLFSKSILDYQNRYFTHCNDSEKVFGEFDPTYLYNESALKRIKSQYPDVKIVVCIRNPVHRAFSHFHKHQIKGKSVASTFDQVIKNKVTTYLEPGLYAKYLNNLFQIFNKSSVHIILFDDIESNPEDVLKELFAFLNINQAVVSDYTYAKVNSYGTRIPNLIQLNRALYSLERFRSSKNFPRVLSKIIKLFKLYEIKMWLIQNNMKEIGRSDINVPKLTTAQFETLLSFYKKDISETEKLTSKDLSSWKNCEKQ